MSNPGTKTDTNAPLTGMQKILNGSVLDQRVVVYVGARGFEGTIGETDHQDILVLHTKGGLNRKAELMDIKIESIDAVTWLGN
ncbi:hypothetical protein YA0089_26400 [Pseudomonas viridiflava]|uniref:hypothetical protein n=1 Tax=Pseudomonas viridiflava TaxID=33069 RepID=UPI0018E64945|nr:hypothetical protein [Pseudomonas viridiflava]MBI6727148.1 hypothetical protein [Pseudomonas viridiflava]